MMNYNNRIHTACEPCTELVQVAHYCSSEEIPAKSNTESIKRNNEIRVELSRYAPCACIGCQYYAEAMNDEGQYCCNSKAIWYLSSTGCRCDLKKLGRATRKRLHKKVQLRTASYAAKEEGDEDI